GSPRSEPSPLSLHDALPIYVGQRAQVLDRAGRVVHVTGRDECSAVVDGLGEALRVDRRTVVALEDHDLDIASHEPLVREGGEVERTEDYAWTPAVVQRRRDDGERGGYAGREADLLLRRVQHACDAAAQLRQPAEPDLVPRRRAERMPLVVELCDARFRATRERAERAGV